VGSLSSVSSTESLTLSLSSFPSSSSSWTFKDKFIETPDNLRPGVISISYGSEEASMTQDQFNAMCNSAQILTAMGTTIGELLEGNI